MNRDQIIIIFLVGVMVFSAIASGLLFLNDDSTLTSDEIAANEEARQQAAEEALANTCTSSEEAQANAGTPAGQWPTMLDDTLTELETIDLREGDGRELALGDCISVHYRLSLADGTEVSGNNTFEDLGEPIAFELLEGALIEGWLNGLPGMKEGGFRRLHVPAAQAYGDNVRPGIPANSDLIFDVELVKIEDQPENG